MVGVFLSSSACFFWLTGVFYVKTRVLNCLPPVSWFLVDDQLYPTSLCRLFFALLGCVVFDASDEMWPMLLDSCKSND